MPSTASVLVHLSLAFLPSTLARPQAISPSPSPPPETHPPPLTTHHIPRDPPTADNPPLTPGIIATVIIISILAVLATVYFLINYRIWTIDSAAERERLRKRAAQAAAREEEEFADYIYTRGWEAYQWEVHDAELEGWRRWVLQRRTKAWGWG